MAWSKMWLGRLSPGLSELGGHSDSELSCVFKGTLTRCVWEVHGETSSVSRCSDSELCVWDVHDSTFGLSHVPTANYVVKQTPSRMISRCVWEVWSLIRLWVNETLVWQRTVCLGCSLSFLTEAECSDSELPLICQRWGTWLQSTWLFAFGCVVEFEKTVYTFATLNIGTCGGDVR